MNEISERYKKVAAAFTPRAGGVPAGAWDNPAPCEGWVARDVVRHMVEWMPGMVLASVGAAMPTGPSVDDEAAGAWKALDDALQAALDDPEVSARELDMRVGRYRVDEAIDMFCTGDIVIHTWDLARATGQDERLDPVEVHRLFDGMEPLDEVLRQSGQYGPRVDVAPDADEQTRLIAFTGRQP
jgi:uncharacterized protein (TIGR03086 family)